MKTYGASRVVGEPDGGELVPADLPLADVLAGGERIVDPHGVLAFLPVQVDALALLLRSRRRRTRHDPMIPPIPILISNLFNDN